MWSSPCHLVVFPCAVYLLKLLGNGAGLLRPGPSSAAASTCGWDQQTEPLPRWMYIVLFSRQLSSPLRTCGANLTDFRGSL